MAKSTNFWKALIQMIYIMFRGGQNLPIGFSNDVIVTVEVRFLKCFFFCILVGLNPSFTKGEEGGGRADPSQRFFFDNF